MIDEPYVISYNTEIAALASAEAGRAGSQKAEKLLQTTIDLNDDSMKPSQVTYTSVINAWANARAWSDGAQKAEDWLQKMIDLKDDDTKPNDRTFNSVIKALSGAGMFGSFNSTLENMSAFGFLPNAITFTAIFLGLRGARIDDVLEYLGLSESCNVALGAAHVRILDRWLGDPQVRSWFGERNLDIYTYMSH